MPTLPAKIARPPRGADIEDWQQWAEEVERIINLLLSGSGQTYTVTNGTIDRAYDANATTINELADVLSTLIADLKTSGTIE